MMIYGRLSDASLASLAGVDPGELRSCVAAAALEGVDREAFAERLVSGWPLPLAAGRPVDGELVEWDADAVLGEAGFDGELLEELLEAVCLAEDELGDGSAW